MSTSSAQVWKEFRAAKVAAPLVSVSRLYPTLDAGGHYRLSTTAGDQDATMSLKSSRLFLDVTVPDGGILGLDSVTGHVELLLLPPI